MCSARTPIRSPFGCSARRSEAHRQCARSSRGATSSDAPARGGRSTTSGRGFTGSSRASPISDIPRAMKAFIPFVSASSSSGLVRAISTSSPHGPKPRRTAVRASRSCAAGIAAARRSRATRCTRCSLSASPTSVRTRSLKGCCIGSGPTEAGIATAIRKPTPHPSWRRSFRWSDSRRTRENAGDRPPRRPPAPRPTCFCGAGSSSVSRTERSSRLISSRFTTRGTGTTTSSAD